MVHCFVWFALCAAHFLLGSLFAWFTFLLGSVYVVCLVPFSLGSRVAWFISLAWLAFALGLFGLRGSLLLGSRSLRG